MRIRRLARGAALAVACLVPPAYAAQVSESEPNNAAGRADPISEGDFALANLTPIADLDYWTRESGAGHLLFARVDTTGAVPSMNSVLRAIAGDGSTVLAINDNVRTLTSSALGGIPLPGGTFFIQLNENSSSSIVPYRLFQTVVDPVAEAQAEAEPNDSPATANPIRRPLTNGNLVSSAGVDVFSFEAEAGREALAILDNDPEKNGAVCEAHVQILAPDGVTVLAENPNSTSGTANAAEVAGRVALAETGRHYVRVRHNLLAPGEFTYRFVLLLDGAVYRDLSTPSPTPSPTAGATTSPTASPTGSPSPTPSPSATASPTASPTPAPGSILEALLGAIPESPAFDLNLDGVVDAADLVAETPATPGG